MPIIRTSFNVPTIDSFGPTNKNDVPLAKNGLNLNEGVLDEMQNPTTHDNRYSKLVSLKLEFGDNQGALSTASKIEESLGKNLTLFRIVNSMADMNIAEEAADRISEPVLRIKAYSNVLHNRTMNLIQKQRIFRKFTEDNARLKEERNRQCTTAILIFSVAALVLGKSLNVF